MDVSNRENSSKNVGQACDVKVREKRDYIHSNA
jgi:hypothetical protein